MIKTTKKRSASSLLGLVFDGSRVEGAWLRRVNDGLELRKAFVIPLTLELLTGAPELVGREIRDRLDELGIRERRCIVGFPVSWALSLETKLPPMPEEDIASFLQIEAERGFPYGPEALLVACSQYRSGGGDHYATQVAVPKDQILRLESVLKFARLQPSSFALGINPSQWPDPASKESVIVLDVTERAVNLMVSCGGGVACLRTLSGDHSDDVGLARPYADVIARETRITLGQLAPDVRQSIRVLRVVGQGERARQLAEDIHPRATTMGMKVEFVPGTSAKELGLQKTSGDTVGTSCALAALDLQGRRIGLEFLPPKVNPWRQFAARYSTKKLAWTGAAAAVVAVLAVALFLTQQWQLSRLRSKWAGMSSKVAELENLQQQIRRFRPWFDDSLRGLTILRKLTESFPEDGSVTAKVVEIRELSMITCSGSAKDRKALLKTEDLLRSYKEVTGLKEGQAQGTAPLQFSFNFQWVEGGGNERQ